MYVRIIGVRSKTIYGTNNNCVIIHEILKIWYLLFIIYLELMNMYK